MRGFGGRKGGRVGRGAHLLLPGLDGCRLAWGGGAATPTLKGSGAEFDIKSEAAL